MRQLLPYFFALFFCFDAFSQTIEANSDSYHQLSIKQGLSSNEVNDILQDNRGFYWISTNDGLNRFDGSVFKIFRHNSDDSLSISHSLCTDLVEGNDGDIWIATVMGVCRYRQRTNSFKRYYFQANGFNSDILNRVYSLQKDADGNIWVTTYGLWKIDPVNDSITAFMHDPSNPASISDATQTGNLHFDKINNGLWLRSSETINFFDLVTKQFYHYRNNPKHWPILNQRWRPLLTMDEKGSLWTYQWDSRQLLQYKNGIEMLAPVHVDFPRKVARFFADTYGHLVFCFDLKPSVFYNIPGDNIAEITSPGIVGKLYKDRANNTWFCTPKGAYVARSESVGVKTYSVGTDEDGLPRAIWAIAVHNNNIWLGVKKGLYKYDRLQQKLREIKPSLFRKSIAALYNDGDSVLWIGSENLITRYSLQKNKLLSESVFKGYPNAIVIDKTRRCWVISWDDGLYEFDQWGKLVQQYGEREGLGYRYLVGSFYDGGNNLWVGMNGERGFARFEIPKQRFVNYSIKADKNVSIASKTINALVEDSIGNLWLGTYGGGLYYYDRQRSSFTNYRQNKGLSSDFINTLALDKNANLWISTVKGVNMMDVKTKNILHVNEEMQFDNNDYINNFTSDSKGFFYYTSNGKVIVIDPGKYIQVEKDAEILVSSFKILDKEMPEILSDSSITLNYNQNFFTLDYSVLKPSPEIAVQYAYKLDGLDKDWNYTGNRGVANYTNLPHGKYTLLLNGTNETGRWNAKPLSLSIIIKPPFWKTWWFYTLSVFLITFLLDYVIRSRVRQFEKRQQEQLRLIVATQEREKKNISSELHDDLGVRLSALKYFVADLKKYLLPNDRLASETYNRTMSTIDESVEDIRYMLINLSPKTLNEYGYLTAVEDLVNKLSRLHIIAIDLQQNGIEGRFHPDIEAGLYRITQELINNTLKHAGATAIHLNIERQNGTIQFEYSDNGRSFISAQHFKGYGIENIHTRVALMNGEIKWNNAADQFTSVIITVPYNHT